MEFKLIDLNVWNGGKLKSEILTFLESENPDILNLQEVFRSTNPDSEDIDRTEDLLRPLAYEHSYYSPAYFDIQRNAESGNLILSRYPIINTSSKYLYGKYFYYPHGQDPKYFNTLSRIIQHAEINLNGTLIHDFNIHGVWAHRDGSDSPNRLKMSDIIVDEIKDKNNVILTGDFNTQEGTKTINNIENYLTNIFKGERKTSFNMQQKTDQGYAEAVVDFIFASKNIKVVEKSMPGVNISDHLPLVAKFAL